MEQKFYKRYVGRFVGICLALFIVMAFLPTPGLFNLLVTMGTAFYVGRLFAKDHNRAPDAPEQNRFALVGFLVLVGIVAALTFVLVAGLPQEAKDAFFAPFQEKSMAAMIIGTLLAILMMWGSIHFGFGLGAKLYMKKVKPNEA